MRQAEYDSEATQTSPEIVPCWQTEASSMKMEPWQLVLALASIIVALLVLLSDLPTNRSPDGLAIPIVKVVPS